VADRANRLAERVLAALPGWLHRGLLRTLQPLRLRLWGILRREVAGVMVLGFTPDGRLLLVRHSYHLPDQWLVPGGGRAPGEDAIATATREMTEEAGCTLIDAAHLGQILRRMPHGWTNRIDVVTGTIHGTPIADLREITEVTLVDPGALPADTNAAVHEYLALRRVDASLSSHHP